MKKTTLYITTFLLVILLTACSSPTTTEESNGTISNPVSESITEETGSPTVLNNDYENALPVQMQLLLGTVELDESDYGVDSEQASALLPLWKAARSFSDSETVASAEIAAIFSQIEDTMTSEQIKAIAAMQLAQTDFVDLANDLGVETGGGDGTRTPEMRATAQAMRESGQAPSGGAPGGGLPVQGSGPGGGLPGGAAGGGAPSKGQGPRGASSGINSMFYDAIIEFLEGKIN